MYPNSINFGLKLIPIKVLWAQSIHYLGTWTLGFGIPNASSIDENRCRDREDRALGFAPETNYRERLDNTEGGGLSAEMLQIENPKLPRGTSRHVIQIYSARGSSNRRKHE